MPNIKNEGKKLQVETPNHSCQILLPQQIADNSINDILKKVKKVNYYLITKVIAPVLYDVNFLYNFRTLLNMLLFDSLNA